MENDQISVDISGDFDEIQVKERELNSCQVPSYNSTSNGFLSNEVTVEVEQVRKSLQVCWNCEGSHNLSECTQRRNPQAISRNKAKFMKNKPVPNVRYHQEKNEKYAAFKPGVISDKLQSALGLQEWQAPEFIYRMRVLGYPPGWLKEAEVHRAEVSIIDGDGSVLSHPEDEEGEVDCQSLKFEPDKLVSYPGFNIPFEDNIEDESRYYGCPKMQFCHSRKEFERIMKGKRATKYKKKRIQKTSKPANKSNREMETAEIEESNGETQHFSPLPKEDDIIITDEANCEEDITEKNSLQKSIVALGTENSTATEKNIMDLDSSTKNKEMITPVNSSQSSNSIDSPRTPATGRNFQHRSLSKSFNYGVGIPGTTTPDHTPPAEKWSVGISGHIDFDNIPDSTGKWDKINKIMGRVRLQMNELHEDD